MGMKMQKQADVLNEMFNAENKINRLWDCIV